MGRIKSEDTFNTLVDFRIFMSNDVKQDVQSVVDAYFDGLQTNDFSNVPLAEDVILENPETRTRGEPYRGRQEVLDFLNTAAPNMPRVDVDRHVIDGNEVCTILEFESSEGVVVPTVDLFEIEDGVITRIQIYLDLSASDLLPDE